MKEIAFAIFFFYRGLNATEVPTNAFTLRCLYGETTKVNCSLLEKVT